MLPTLKSMDYGRVVSAKKLKGSGLSFGDILMVAGTLSVPASKKDPYLHRTLVKCIRVVDGEHQLPGNNNDYQAYMIDPRSLEALSEDETKELRNVLQEEYGT